MLGTAQLSHQRRHCACGMEQTSLQPHPQGLLLVQSGGRRNPWPRLKKWLQKFVRISSRKHDLMSSFCVNNGFRLQKTNRAARRWKQPPKKPFHHVSRDKILYDSWSISAALARGFSDRHFERGEGPGNEVDVTPVGPTRVIMRNPQNHKRYSIQFVVVRDPFTPLVGARAAQQMKLTTRISLQPLRPDHHNQKYKGEPLLRTVFRNTQISLSGK